MHDCVRRPLGDYGDLFTFSSFAHAHAFLRELGERPIEGIIDAVCSGSAVGVIFDSSCEHPRDLTSKLSDLAAAIASNPASAVPVEGKRHVVPACYDGPDLDDCARALGISVEDLIAAHSSQSYVVHAVGFLPGFPYAGDLPPRLQGLARRTSPRARAPAGSIAIVGTRTAIYPQDSPAGWHLIARTPLVIADLRAAWFPIAPGDALVFSPIDSIAFDALRGERLQ